MALLRWMSACACAALMAPVSALADEVGAASSASGLVIHEPEETLRDWCDVDDEGRVWLDLPGGLRFELVASIDDPAIPNRGDGSFHPYDVAEVNAALAAVRFPLEGVTAHVFLLPYPRRHGLESAAGPGLILLSPGVRPIAREHQHAEFVHEMGHVVQYALMPDADTGSWNRYRRIRDIEGSAYAPSSAHADRPHEIFAEDFRYLFGGTWANTAGSIENASLRLPDAVEGLEAFLLGLASPAPTALRVTPNPARGALEFVRAASLDAPLDVYDAAGRRVATLDADAAGGITRWRWDGRGPDGKRPHGAVLFARVRGETEPATPVSLLP